MKNCSKQVGLLILLIFLASACSGSSLPVTMGSTAVPIQDTAAVGSENQPSTLIPSPGIVTNQSAKVTQTAAEEPETDLTQDHSNEMEINRMKITINEQILTASLVDNSSTAALKEALADGPITIQMRDYGEMEKVGSLGMDLPRNDKPINAQAGDIILYQGNALVIYYAPNSWNFTRIGKIDDLAAEELKGILGEGDVTVTISLPAK